MAEEVTYEDVTNYVSARVLAGPEDDIWDAIFDWIRQAVSDILSPIFTLIASAKNWIYTNVRAAVDILLSPIRSIIDWLKSKASDIWYKLISTYDKLYDWVRDAYSTIYRAATSAVSKVKEWITDAVGDIYSYLKSATSDIYKWLQTTSANILSTVKTWWADLTLKLERWFADEKALSLANQEEARKAWLVASTDASQTQAVVASTGADVQTNLQNYINNQVVAPQKSWWENLLGSLERILGGIFNTLGAALKAFSDGLVQYILQPVISAAMVGLGWIADILRPIFQTVLNGVLGLVRSIGPMAPGSAMGATAGLANIGMVMVGGLGALTVIGDLIHPLKALGFANISAMLWDMSNFRVILGAFMGTVAAISIRVPLTYYLNEALRPRIPDERTLSELAREYAITKGEYISNMAYHGYADSWSGKMFELADRPEGYFFLRAIAESGDWDEQYMIDSFKNTGYRMATINKALAAFRRTATTQLRGMMSSVAVTRFKEGFSTESQFEYELRLLRYSEEEIPPFVAAGRIAYATDYLLDLKSAYTDAVRKGNMSLGEFRSALGGLGIVPERIEAFVLRERARVKPTEALTPLAPPTPVYETEGGKVQVDTLRRKRRANLITQDEEIAGLLELGMDVRYAKAVAENDTFRIPERLLEE